MKTEESATSLMDRVLALKENMKEDSVKYVRKMTKIIFM